MSRYIGTRIRTKSTMHRKLKLIRGLVSGSVMLGLVSFIFWPGLKQACVPSVSQMLPLTAELLVKEALMEYEVGGSKEYDEAFL